MSARAPEDGRLPPGADAASARRGRRLSPLTPVVRSLVFLLAAASAAWRDAAHGDLGVFAKVILGVLAVGVVYGAASWLRTSYWIEGDELRVDTGVVSRQSRRIRIDRLQGVDIVQPVSARVFGLAELKMDVAGRGRGEGSLAYLPLREAEELREVLLARRDAARTGRPGSTAAPAPSATAAGAAAPAEQVLERLDPAMLVVSLLLAGETFAFFATALVLVTVSSLLGPAAGVTSLVPVALGFLLVQGRRLAAFSRLTVSQTPQGLQVRRGLLELSSQTIALHRVQGVVVVEPLLWRPLGWARLDVSVAGYGRASGDADRPSESIVLPVGPRPVVLRLARHLLSGLDPAAVRLTPPPARARWAAPVRRRFLAAGVGEQVVAGRAGILTRRTHVVPHARVQSLRVHQGPWQRALGLADLLVDSPEGPVRVRARHRDVAEAGDLVAREQAAARLARAAGPPPTRTERL